MNRPTFAADPDVLRAVAVFRRREFPGESAGEAETAWLCREAARAAGLGPADGGADAALNRRLGSALEAARHAGRPEVRRLAWRGWLRQAVPAVRPGRTAWSLRVAPLLDEPLELWAEMRLRRVAEALADLWPAEDSPLLVLWDFPSAGSREGAPSPEGLARICRTALDAARSARGAAGPAEVLVCRT